MAGRHLFVARATNNWAKNAGIPSSTCGGGKSPETCAVHIGAFASRICVFLSAHRPLI